MGNPSASLERVKMRARTIVTVAMLLLPTLSCAQDVGDAQRGEEYARTHCAYCHGWKRGDTSSPIAKAPTFEAVANTRGMTGTALIVWFRSPHPTMPSLVIAPSDQIDLVAYILSLHGAQLN